VVNLTWLSLNTRFDMSVIFMINYFLMRYDVSIDNEAFLMIDFKNL
jgi:hypothetical protein